MEAIKLEEITPEKLDQIANEWEESSISDLVSDSVIKLGEQLREARLLFAELDAKARIRAMRLFHFHNFSKRQIADLFGVEIRQVTKWLK